MEAENAALRAYYERGMERERLGDGRRDLEFTRTTEIVLRRLPAAPGAGLADDPGLKASQHSTGGALSVFETTVEAGPPLHVHDREDECFYVLEGELSIRCGSDVFDALAGSFVSCPRPRAPVLGQGPVRPAAHNRRSRRD